MKINYKKSIFGLVLFFMAANVFAFSEKVSLGTIAQSLSVSVDVLTKIMHIVSISMGIAMFIMAISFYKAHRVNPKFMPLDRLVLYVVLGFILILIPFLGDIVGPTGSSIDYHKHQLERSGVQFNDIDAPLNWGNDYNH